MALSLKLGLILHDSAVHRHGNLFLMILLRDYFPDLWARRSLNLLASGWVLECSIYAFGLPHSKRRVTANTWVKTLVSWCSSLNCRDQVLLVICSRFYIVVFQNLSNLAFLVKHKIARDYRTSKKFLWLQWVVLVRFDAVMLRLNRQIVLSCGSSFVYWCLFYHGTRGDHFPTRSNFISPHKTWVLLLFNLLFDLNGPATTWRPH